MSKWLSMAATEHAIRYVQAGPIRTRFLEAGPKQAETVLLLHGSGGYLEAYLRNVPAHAEHFHTIAIDMMGHGFSDKPNHPYEIRHYVRHLLDFCDAMGLDRVHISGESLGGWVAARFAAQHPDRTGRIVLNTAAGVHYDPALSARVHALSMQAAAQPTLESVRKRLEWLMLDPVVVTDEMVEFRYRIYAQPGFASVMQNIMCLHTGEYRVPNLITVDEMRSIRAPTLVLWTTHDPGSTVEIGQRLANGIPGARFVVMENCGHWPQFEDADKFNSLQLGFLRE